MKQKVNHRKDLIMGMTAMFFEYEVKNINTGERKTITDACFYDFGDLINGVWKVLEWMPITLDRG